MKLRPTWILLAAVAIAVAVAGFAAFGPEKLDEAEIESLLRQAEASLEQGDTQAARVCLDRVLRAQPEHSRGLLYFGQLLRDEGRDDEALRAWSRVRSDDEAALARARFLTAMVLLDRNQARDAERLLHDAIDLDSWYLPPHERLLQLYTLQRRRDDILRQLGSLARVRQLKVRELILRLTAGQRIVSVSQAIPRLEGFCAADSDDLESGVALLQYLIDDRQYDRAQQILDRLRPHEEQDRRLCALQIRLHVEDTSVRRPVDCAQDIGTATLPEEPVLLTGALSQLTFTHEDWDSCVASGLAVLARDPLNQSACFHVGTALQRLGREAAAETFLQRSERIGELHQRLEGVGIYDARDQLTAGSLVDVARLLEALGEVEQAGDWLAAAASLNPASLPSRDQRSSADSSEPFTDLLARLSTQFEVGPIHDQADSNVPAADSDNVTDVGIRLDDVHRDVGVHHVYFNGQTGLKYLLESMGGGVAVVDFDRDEWPDLFFPQGSDLPDGPRTGEHHDRLFRNRAARQFDEVTTPARVGDTAYSVGCAAADFDNDGFPDLFVANFGRCTLFHNRGDGTFEEIGLQAGLIEEAMSMGVGPGDFDGDGDLDLYVVNYVDHLQVCRNDDGEISTCNPVTANGVDDRICLNDGRGNFHSISGVGLASGGRGLGVVIADLDSDSKPDIYVANDMTPNFLLINQSEGGNVMFREQGMLAGCATDINGASQAGMGIACGDLNGDQSLDLYVTNFYREPNTLYVNAGNGLFADATRATGLYQPTLLMLGFGTQAVDFDLDGRLDLFVANGHINDIRGEPWKMRPQLFQNAGPSGFRDASDTCGSYFHEELLGRGVATCDWNRDGLPDLIVVHQDREAAVIANRTATANKAISCRLVGRQSNRDAFGAKLEVSIDGTMSFFELTSGNGFCASNEPLIQIGLGEADHAESIDVTWPSGVRQRVSAIPAGARVTIVEGSRVLISTRL
jgi:tetratricopeptide (TPR) repeat protein